MRARTGPVVALLAAASLVAACSSSPGATPVVSTPAAPAASAAAVASAAPVSGAPIFLGTQEYPPGIQADVRLPAATGAAPLIVLVPGGGWQTADRSGLTPLAEALTIAGATTANITYRTTADGTTFPTPAEDVACAVRWAAQRATEEGRPPSRTIVAGHSAGGHLAALVALSGDAFGSDCPAPPASIDGLVGIAGIYDPDGMEPVMEPLFGSSRGDQPDVWEKGSPIAWAARDGLTPEGFRTLLIHGPGDTLVPAEQSLELADALTGRGVDTLVEFVADGTHQSVYQADVAAPLIQKWLDAWP